MVKFVLLNEYNSSQTINKAYVTLTSSCKNYDTSFKLIIPSNIEPTLP